ncbi:hypothetical protein FQA39_LY12012 [Lamprigera yunnana]|nr:hypothetical protein FQA39_LY12012 [Lamprigera yunnana]
MLNRHDSVRYCVEKFVRQVFNRDRPIYYVSDGNAPMIVPQDGENQYVIVNISKPIHLTLKHPGYYILQAINKASLGLLTRNLKSSNMWNVFSSTGAKYLTIITESNVSDIFQILWKNDFAPVAVISINNNRPKVHTSDPYREENQCGKFCGDYSTTKCDSSSINLQNTTGTFNSCCALFSHTYGQSGPVASTARNILKQFNRYFNLSITILDRLPKEINCSIVFSMASNGDFKDLSEPIFIYNFCWVTFVQKVSSVYVLRYVFDKWVCTMIATAFLAITLAWCLMLKFVNKKWNIVASVMNVWELSLSGCILNFPKPRCIKCLILFYLLFIMIIHTGFKSDLAQLLTVDHYDTTFDNLNDLVNSAQPLCTSELFLKRYFNKTDNITNMYTKVKSKINTYAKEQDLLKRKNCTTLVYCRDVRRVKKANNIKVHYILDNSLTGSFKMYFKIKKGHQFKSCMNTFIKRLKESGIHEYIVSKTIEPIKNYKKPKEETKLTVLTVDHVYSFFVIWAIGILIAIVHDSVRYCVENFVRQVFNRDRLIYYVSDGHAPMIVPQDGKNQYVVVNISKPIHLTLKHPGYYILQAKNKASLGLLTRKLKLSNMWNVFSSTGAKYLAIISASNVPDIFQILWKNDIAPVAVISINNNRPKVHTSDPYCEENQCGKFCKDYSTTKCDSSTIKFQNTSKTFNSCCALFSHNYGQKSIAGRTARNILNQFERYLNLPIEILDQFPKEINCSIVFSMAINGDLKDLSEPFFIDNFCWITFVQKVSSVYVLRYVFDKWVWMMIATAFLAITLAWCLMLKFSDKKWHIVASLTNVWALSLLGCISKFPKSRCIKCLVLFYLLFITIIQTGFKTNLAQLLTIDHYDTTFDNLNDLANSDQPLCTSQLFFRRYFNKTNNITNTYTKVKGKINTYVKQQDFLNHKNCTSLVSWREGSRLKKLYNIKVHYFFDNSLTGSFKMYFKIKKGHQFKIYMNTFIKRLKESGIHEYILSKTFKSNTNYKKPKEETKLTVLTLDHVYSFFVIWVIGILIAIVVFIFEIVNKY